MSPERHQHLVPAPSRYPELVALFTESFGTSEGQSEGRAIGALADALLRSTPADDRRVFASELNGSIVGAVLFTRLRFGDDTRRVFLLSPMAVSTQHQRQGVGQALIRHGLESLQAEGVDLAVTYGDPAYYGQLGFVFVSTESIPAPLPLSLPQGWLARPMDANSAITPLHAPARCAAALCNTAFW